MNMMEDAFSTVFERCRREAKLTQQQLADKTGFAIATICHYENAKRYPTADAMANICEAFGISMGTFWGMYDQYLEEQYEVKNIAY